MSTKNNIYFLNRIKYLLLSNCKQTIVIGKIKPKTNIGNLIITDMIKVDIISKSEFYNVIGIKQNSFKK